MRIVVDFIAKFHLTKRAAGVFFPKYNFVSLCLLDIDVVKYKKKKKQKFYLKS